MSAVVLVAPVDVVLETVEPPDAGAGFEVDVSGAGAPGPLGAPASPDVALAVVDDSADVAGCDVDVVGSSPAIVVLVLDVDEVDADGSGAVSSVGTGSLAASSPPEQAATARTIASTAVAGAKRCRRRARGVGSIMGAVIRWATEHRRHRLR